MLFDCAMKLAALPLVRNGAAGIGYPPTADFARGLGVTALVITALYAWRPTSVLGAVLLTGYMGGTVAAHLRVGNPIFSHMLFGVYLAIFAWGGLYLREPRLRALMPIRTRSAEESA